MKCFKLVVLVGFLATTHTVSAQIAIELEKMNAFYPVVENPLTISFESVPDSNLILIPSRGEIQRKSEGRYIWQICECDTHVVFLSIFDKNADTLLRKAAYRVLPFPIPRPVMDELFTGFVLLFQDFDGDLRPLLVGFDVTYFAKGQDPVTKCNFGNRFSPDVRSLIQRASIGDKYIFHDIKYKLPCNAKVHVLEEEIIYTID